MEEEMIQKYLCLECGKEHPTPSYRRGDHRCDVCRGPVRLKCEITDEDREFHKRNPNHLVLSHKEFAYLSEKKILAEVGEANEVYYDGSVYVPKKWYDEYMEVYWRNRKPPRGNHTSNWHSAEGFRRTFGRR